MTSIRSRQAGLTLIETMAALFIFTMTTLGITPLLIGSIKGSAESRSYTIGKNVTVQAMERIRGLPFFESTRGVASPTRTDVLDLYYPDMGSGYASGKFTTTCTDTTQTPTASGTLACPPELQDGSSSIPDDLTVRFEAQFVRPGTESGGQQNFDVVTPTNYNWATLATESPPAQLIRMAVIASWPMGGATKTFRLTSLIGERALSPDRVRGQANVDFALQALTSYLGDDGKVTTLNANVGDLASEIATRSVSAADQSTQAARLVLATEEFNGAPGTVLQDLFGATTTLHAPVDSWYAPDASGTIQTVSYQKSPSSSPLDVASIATTSGTGNGARVDDELPGAEGVFSFTGTEPVLWVDNQASTGNRAELLLHNTRNVLQIRKATLGLGGWTKAETSALTPTGSRKVETSVNARVGRLDLFATTFIDVEQRAVVSIRDFQLDLKCTSTANPSSAGVTGTWSARIKWWADTSNNSQDDGNYVTERTIGGSIAGGTEQLEAVQTANPLVYDHGDSAKDVYLFKTATQKGYLQDWSMNPTILWNEDATGRTTTASIEGALQIITAPSNPLIEASALNVTLGKASCLAVDKR